MSQIKLAFVANDGNAYAPETEIGKQLGFITWTPSKLRIERAEGSFLDDEVKVTLGQRVITIQEFLKENQIKKEGKTPEQIANEEKEILSHKTYIEKVIADLPGDIQAKYKNKIDAPKVLFYTDENGKPSKESSETINVTIPAHKNFVDIYVGGLFQKEALYGGASAEGKDIIITANGNDAYISTMIRVRRNANELTKKAKTDFVKAFSLINKRDKEGNGIGIYSTDFYNMHVAGAVAMGHGDSMFLPWHRLLLLDVERQMQNQIPESTLHFWKFDEAAPNIFKRDFLGETISYNPNHQILTEGFTDCFARFEDGHPFKNWAIANEKLLRRQSFFDNQNKNSNTNLIAGPLDVHMISEKAAIDKGDVLGIFNPNDIGIFTNIEIQPHGTAHVSFNGPVNNVPTAIKDPIFFFIHCQVDHLWAKWQIINERFEVASEESYPYQKLVKDENGNDFPQGAWKLKTSTQWPWDNTAAAPGGLMPPGTRVYNFTQSIAVKNFEGNVPIIADTIDAFGVHSIVAALGFDYADCAPFAGQYVKPTTTTPKLINEHIIKLDENVNVKSIVLKDNNDVNLLIESLELIKEILSKDLSTQGESDAIIKLMNKLAIINPEINEGLKKLVLYVPTNFGDWEKIKQKVYELLVPIIIDKLNLISFNLIFPSVFKGELPKINNIIFLILLSLDKKKWDSPFDGLLVSILNKLYIYLSYQNHKETIDLLQGKFNTLKDDINKPKSISNFFIVYLLFSNDKNSYSDEIIFKTIDKNKDYFKDIKNEDVLDVKIALYSFASNSSIKDKIIPLFFTNKVELEAYLNDLNSKSEGSDSLSNKYWALHTLLTNAGVGQ